VSSFGIVFTLVASLLVCFAPRRIAALVVLASVCYISQYEKFEVGGFNFTAIRSVLFVAMLRVVIRKDMTLTSFSRLDKALLVYPTVITLLYTIRLGSSAAFVYQLGCSYDVLLAYWVFRSLVPNLNEVRMFIVNVAYVIFPLAIFMVAESVTHHNFFGIELPDTYMRAGRLRCAGAFRGPITAGTFGACWIPLFVGVFSIDHKRLPFVLGIVSSLAIVYTSNSSGPLMCVFGSIVAFGFWAFREKMRSVRWGIIGALIFLHLTMKVPVWFLFSKIEAITGGHGWHRSYLIDQAIRHLGDWWLLGTSGTGVWMPTAFENGEADITNQFLLNGVNAGLLGIAAFVAIFVMSFKELGNALRTARHMGSEFEKFFWCCGCMVFAHLLTIFTVEYFDQMRVVFYATLALVATVCGSFRQDFEDERDSLQTENSQLPLVAA
jgi:hypothetical protein